MGDIIKTYKVKGVNIQSLNLYFDSGSPITFVGMSTAKKLGGLMNLPFPVSFNGLGGGKFFSKYAIYIEIELLGIWCGYLCHVVDDNVIDEDILIGHDFMQRYDVKLDTKNRDVIIDKKALLRGQKIR